MTLTDGSYDATERQLLDQLGDRDPAESQRETLDAWRTLLAEAADAAVIRPADGEWSAVEVLGHLVESEIVNALRYRAMLAEECPTLERYDRATWRPLLQSPADVDGARQLLAMFAALREANLSFWASLDGEARRRTAIDPGCGEETIELRFRMLAGHDRLHLAQARAAVDAVLSRK